MTKDNLKTGMIVELRDGTKMIVLKNTQGGEFGGIDIFKDISNNKISSKWEDFTKYNNDLTHTYFNNFDIVKVYGSNFCHKIGTLSQEVIWQRAEESLS